MTPAEELREATKLLRERAGAATPGPWAAWVMGSEGYLVLRKHGTIRERGRGRVARVGLKDWDSDKADAEYIATMHPGVALAVADWLDETGRQAESCIDATSDLYAPACLRCSGDMGDTCRCWNDALAVAHAILGTGEAGQ